MDLVNNLETFADIAKAKAFLGREFLTWLWYVAESRSDAFAVAISDKESLEIRVWVDDRMVLESTDNGTHSMKGGRPGQSPEAAISLRNGKSVSDIKVGIDIAHWGAFTATIDHRDLTPRGIKLPVDDPEQMAAAAPADEPPMERRLHLTGIFLAVIDGLFQDFLDHRTRDSWQEDGLEPMRAWIRERYQESAAVYH